MGLILSSILTSDGKMWERNKNFSPSFESISIASREIKANVNMQETKTKSPGICKYAMFHR